MVNEAILASDVGSKKWLLVGTTNSNLSSWAFDRLRLYYPNWFTEVGVFSQAQVDNNSYVNEKGQTVINVDEPAFGSQAFSSTNAYEHDFNFDLSSNTGIVYLAISGIPIGAEFQQIYVEPTGYSATTGIDSEITTWDFSVINTGLNVGGVDTSIFMENSPLFAIYWNDNTRTPALYAKTLHFHNSQLGDDDLDKLIIWADNGGQTNGTLKYENNGTAEPTNASRSAWENLNSKGWTITGAEPPLI